MRTNDVSLPDPSCPRRSEPQVTSYNIALKAMPTHPLVARQDQSLTTWLDNWVAELRGGGSVTMLMIELYEGLASRRNGCSRTRWRTEIERFRLHDAFAELLSCPMTLHAFRRPLGYPGDSFLIDFMYRHQNVASVVKQASPLGQEIYEFVSNVAGSHEVRERRCIIARQISACLARNPAARILSVGCGAMRELEFVPKADQAEIVGLDHDPRSLATARMDRNGRIRENVKGVTVDIKHLIRCSFCLGSFDLIYAAGLFDYLSQKLAIRLLQKLFEMLRREGKLLVCNFSPIVESGYMEAAMDWHLVYRTEEEMRELAARYPNANFFSGSKQCIRYLELEHSHA